MENRTEECVYRLWNDKTGERLEIASDRDSLKLIEILRYDATDILIQSIIMTDKEASWLSEMLAEKVLNG